MDTLFDENPFSSLDLRLILVGGVVGGVLENKSVVRFGGEAYSALNWPWVGYCRTRGCQLLSCGDSR